MNNENSFVIVDADCNRRAAVSHLLSGLGQHAEPYSGMDELNAYWQRGDIMFVHDDGRLCAEVIDFMARKERWLPMIAYSQNPSPAKIVDVMLAGAVDYVEWPISAATLKARLEHLHQRQGTMFVRRKRGAAARRRISALSQREFEVLQLLADGFSNKDIARQLAISPRTVEIHRSNMRSKLGVNGSADAVRIAVESGLLLEPENKAA